MTQTDPAAADRTQPDAGSSVDALMDRMFLSPRVVDQRAYDELAGSLRTLVRDAAAQAKALEGTGAEVKLYGEQLRQATRELQERVEGAVKVVPSIDSRVAKIEQLVDLVARDLHGKVTAAREVVSKEVVIDKASVAPAVEAAARDAIGTLLAEKLNGLKAQITAMVAEEEAQASRRIRAMTDAAEKRLRESAAAIAEEAQRMNLGSLTEERERAEQAIATIGDLVARAEDLHAGVGTMARRLEELQDQAAAVAASFESEVPARANAYAEKATQIGTWINDLLDQAESIGGALHSMVKRAEEARGGPAQ